MITLSLPVDVYLCTLPTDMRKSFDGLLRMAEEYLQQNVLQGGLFVFVNRRRDRVKLLYWDNDGLAIWYKRLEAGTFEIPQAEGAAHVALSAAELAMLLGEVELSSARKRKRFQLSR